MKHTLILLLIVSQFLFSSCAFFNKDTKPRVSQSDSIYLFTYELMKFGYLWIDELNDVNWKLYVGEDPGDLMYDMSYKKLDRWSSVVEKKDFESFFTGENLTYGFTPILDVYDNCRAMMVYRHSPAYAAGLRRGSIITKINNTDPRRISDWSFMGGSEIGSIEIAFLDQGKEVSTIVNKSVVQVDQILNHTILQTTAGKTGYIAYETFTPLSSDSIVAVMKHFKTSGVSELIVDLRYNRGGDMDVLCNWINYLLPSSAANQQMLTYSHNRFIASKEDTTVYAQPSPFSLSLDQIFIITTKYTASASEALINTLKPYMDVHQIGTKTHGKPVGMYVFDFQDWYLLPISFKLVNKNGEGGYFYGIEPELEMQDDPAYDWGDPNDPIVAQAIHYIETGSYSQGVLASASLKSDVFLPVPFRQIGLIAKPRK